MPRNKVGLEFTGWKELIAELDSLDGDVKKATEKALVESQKIVAEESRKAISKHHKTGLTEESIIEDETVEWDGMTAGIGVGFRIRSGGLPSIFLMYGTPRMDKDTKVYNAVYGKKVKDRVAAAQEETVQSAIAERRG